MSGTFSLALARLRPPQSRFVAVLVGVICVLCCPGVSKAGTTFPLERTFGQVGEPPFCQALRYPRALAFDELDHSLLVDDRWGGPIESGTIHVYDEETGFDCVQELTPLENHETSEMAADPEHNRVYIAGLLTNIEVYALSGAFIETIASNINGEAIQARSIAVAPSGELYVANNENNTMDTFSATGKPVASFKTLTAAKISPPTAIAVGETGNILLVSQYGGVGTSSGSSLLELNAVGQFQRVLDSGPVDAVAIDNTTGEVFAAHAKYVSDYEADGALKSRFGGPVLDKTDAVAVDQASGDVFVADEQSSVVDEFGPSSPAPEVKTDEVQDLSQTEGLLCGEINPASNALSASYDFQYATAEYYKQHEAFSDSVPAEPVVVGTGTSFGSTRCNRVSALTPNTTYDYRILGFNPNANGQNGQVEGETASFITPGPPSVEGEAATHVDAGNASLQATITPNGAATQYYFEYGVTAGYGSGKLPAQPIAVGDGRAAVTVSVSVAGLSPETEYHYRVVAFSQEGANDGEDASFTTFGAPMSGLPDQRQYELVSRLPGESVEAYAVGLLDNANAREHTQPFQASSDGDAMAYVGNPSEEGNGVSDNENVARRSATGWNAKNESPATGTPSSSCPQPVSVAAPFAYLSPELTAGVVALVPSVTLASATGVAPCYVNLFVRNLTEDTNAWGSYQPLMPEPPENRTAADFGYTETGSESPTLIDMVGGASGGLERVFFAVNGALPGTAGPFGLFTQDDLYESDGGVLRSVNVDPEGAAVPNAVFGSLPSQVGGNYAPGHTTHAVSDDGEVVYWTALGKPSRLYVRLRHEQTVQVDKTRGGPGPSGEGHFWTASSSGSKAYFTDVNRLTPDAVASSGENLYLFEPATESLIDVTGGLPNVNVEGVVGASNDGTIMYFVASGVLTGGESDSLGATAKAGEANLYAYNATAKTIRFVGGLFSGSTEHNDNEVRTFEFPIGDWQGTVGQETAEVAGDGLHVVLASQAKLTSYANASHYEVYEYSYGSNSFVCASCDRAEEPAGESLLFPDLTNGASPHWMSEDGSRVFFDTTERLAAGDENRTWDVYEYEGGRDYLISSGTGTYGSFFDDATPSGNDVFFTTRSRLVPTDVNEEADVYDARVHGGFAEETFQPACGTERECRGESSGSPALLSVATLDAGKAEEPAVHVSEDVARLIEGVTVRRADGAIRVSARLRSGGAVVVRGPYALARRKAIGKAGTVSVVIVLTRTGERRLRRLGRVKVAVTVMAATDSGEHETVTRAVTLNR